MGGGRCTFSQLIRTSTCKHKAGFPLLVGRSGLRARAWQQSPLLLSFDIAGGDMLIIGIDSCRWPEYLVQLVMILKDMVEV